jgi:hypothetical protein
MAQERLTLTYTQAYFQDRVKELRNQVPNGDPFVFLGALILLNSLASHSNKTIKELLPDEYTRYFKDGIERMAGLLPEFFALHFNGVPNCDKVQHKLAFSHDDTHHLGESVSEDGLMVRHIISAGKFLDTISQSINAVYDTAKDDELLALRLYLNVNERRLFGHGK